MASRREQAGLPVNWLEFMRITLDLLREMPMPATRQQIADAVADHLGLTPEQRAIRIPSGQNNYVEFAAGWASNDLKWVGATEQPRRGLYQLTDEGRTIGFEEVESRHRARMQRLARNRRDQPSQAGSQTADDGPDDEGEPELDWQQQLLELVRGISPEAFEHLSAALLRSAGFDEVEVTGRSGDGGIDGIGIYRPLGLISFHTAFQCKRYQGSVGSGAVRDFRGSFVGRSDRGIILTTGTFTAAALEEAARPGANPVDLIDGEALCDLLREFQARRHRTDPAHVEDMWP